MKKARTYAVRSAWADMRMVVCVLTLALLATAARSQGAVVPTITPSVEAPSPTAVPAAPAAAMEPAAKPAMSNDAIIDAFVATLPAASLDPKLRGQINEAIAHDRAQPFTQRDVIATALTHMHPQFRAALVDYANDRTDAAIATLRRLAEAPDAYLAAHARYFLARTLVTQERYEEALPYLDRTLGDDADRTLYADEATFMKAVIQASLIQRKDAIATFKTFLEKFPKTPERLRIGAAVMIAQLEAIEDGKISDVQDRMDFSRRKLDLEKTDNPTQDQQTEIVALLDKLIKEAEEKEKSGGGGGGGGSGQGQGNGPPSGNGQSTSPANQSTLPTGAGGQGDLHATSRGTPGEEWGKLQDRKREEVLNALKTSFPDRYRELVEQYYRSMQEQETP